MRILTGCVRVIAIRFPGNFIHFWKNGRLMPPKINCLSAPHIHTPRERARRPPWYRAPLVSDMRRRPESQFPHESDRFLTGFVFIVTVFCLVLVFRSAFGVGSSCMSGGFVLFLVRVGRCAFWCARWFRVFSFLVIVWASCPLFYCSRLALRLLARAEVSRLLLLVRVWHWVFF